MAHRGSLAATPEPGGRLAEGVGVQANVLARLLGMPLLRLRADVVLLPVRLTDESPAVVASPAVARAPEPRPARAAPRPASGRTSLDEARRLVSQSERELKALPAPVVPPPPSL